MLIESERDPKPLIKINLSCKLTPIGRVAKQQGGLYSVVGVAAKCATLVRQAMQALIIIII